jgi:hypothetical protein
MEVQENMNIFKKYFSPKKNEALASDLSIHNEVTPIEQIDFANEAIEILHPVLRQYGFSLLKMNVSEYSTSIIWIKNKCYIDLGSNTHPHDAPYFYAVALGEFKEDYYRYADLDCVGLWRLKAIQDNVNEVHDTPFPFGADIKPSLAQTKDDLLNYGRKFLEGDLTEFYFARNKQWNQ